MNTHQLMRLRLPRRGRPSYDKHDPRLHIDNEARWHRDGITKTVYGWIDFGYAPWDVRRIPELPLDLIHVEWKELGFFFAVLRDQDEYLIGRRMGPATFGALQALSPPGMEWFVPEVEDGLSGVCMALLEIAFAVRFGPLEAKYWHSHYEIPDEGIRLLSQGAYPSDVLLWMKNQERLRLISYDMHSNIEFHIKTWERDDAWTDWRAATNTEERAAVFTGALERVRAARLARKNAAPYRPEHDFIASGAEVRWEAIQGYWISYARALARDLPGECRIMRAVDARAPGDGVQRDPATAHIVPTKDILIKQKIACPAGIPLGKVGSRRVLEDDDGKTALTIDDARVAERIFAARPRWTKSRRLDDEIYRHGW